MSGAGAPVLGFAQGIRRSRYPRRVNCNIHPSPLTPHRQRIRSVACASQGGIPHNRTVRRILIAECKQEVSSFNPIPSRYDDFAIRSGAEVFEYHAGRREEVGGALAALQDHAGVELIPTYSAQSITSGGTLAARDFKRIATEFLDAIQSAGPADGAYFALHGAMAS